MQLAYGVNALTHLTSSSFFFVAPPPFPIPQPHEADRWERLCFGGQSGASGKDPCLSKLGMPSCTFTLSCSPV